MRVEGVRPAVLGRRLLEYRGCSRQLAQEANETRHLLGSLVDEGCVSQRSYEAPELMIPAAARLLFAPTGSRGANPTLAVAGSPLSEPT